VAGEDEIEYVLETAGRYLDCPPRRSDVRSIFTGLRPLAAPAAQGQKTKEISRGHKIRVSPSGLVTIIGGKWTTYRKMGEDVVNEAVRGLSPGSGQSTKELKVHGWKPDASAVDERGWYGSDLGELEELEGKDRNMAAALSKTMTVTEAQVVWAVRMEMARTVEDFLARRIRVLQLDARESLRMAPRVADIMARELGRDDQWIREQLDAYGLLVEAYILDDNT
jgi:glycerol-3-phosphate dehydrogenase